MAKDLTVKLGADISDFEKKMASMTAKMQDLGKKMQDIGKTMSMYVTAPIVAMGAASVMAFNKQEAAEKKLRAALDANGRVVDATFEKYKSFASEMQRLTVVGDEVTLEMLQVAESMGLTGEAAMRAVRNSISMQEAFGVNAQSAIRMTAALEQGESSMLSRYIPALKGVEDDTQRAAMAQDILSKAFGVATENAKTGQGAMIQMKNAVGDLMEQFGAILSKVITPFVIKIKELAERFQALDERTKKIIVVVAGLAAAIGPLLISLGFLMTTILPALIAGGALLASAWLPITLVVLGVAAAFAIFNHNAKKTKQAVDELVDTKSLEEMENRLAALNQRLDETKKIGGKKTIMEGKRTADEQREIKREIEYLTKAIEIKNEAEKRGREEAEKYKNIIGETNKELVTQSEIVKDLPEEVIIPISFDFDATEMIKKRDEELAELARFTKETMQTGFEPDVYEPDVDAFVNYYMERMSALADFTKNIMMDAAAMVGDALGSAFSGKGFDMNNILKMFGSWAMRLGTILVASAKALTAFKAAIFTNPAFAIPFGLALIAAGAAVSAAAQSNPMSSGGSSGVSGGGGSSGGGYGAMGERGMFGGSPFTVLVTGELRAEGSNLVAALENENIRRNS